MDLNITTRSRRRGFMWRTSADVLGQESARLSANIGRDTLEEVGGPLQIKSEKVDQSDESKRDDPSVVRWLTQPGRQLTPF